MTTMIVTSRAFNQDISRAKRAALDGPVIITDRGRPAHVLLSIEEYQKLTGESVNIIDMLALPGVEDVAFNPPPATTLYQPADFS
ncbi:MAG: type II toxin-antitoxin system Phd/YefM family antitoxin [Chloroflexota bacterium]